MIAVVPYRADHLLRIEPTRMQAAYVDLVTPEIARSLEGPMAWTFVVDGEPIACAGLAKRWLGNWIAWAFLSYKSGPHMLALTRTIKEYWSRLPKGRIEASTPEGFSEGRRWLNLLGFKCETPGGMANYTPDGSTYMLYSKANL